MIRKGKAEDHLGDFDKTQVAGDKYLNLQGDLEEKRRPGRTQGRTVVVRDSRLPHSDLFPVQTQVSNWFWLLLQTQKLLLFPCVHLSETKVTNIGQLPCCCMKGGLWLSEH